MTDTYTPNTANVAVIHAIIEANEITKQSGILTTYRPAVKTKKRDRVYKVINRVRNGKN